MTKRKRMNREELEQAKHLADAMGHGSVLHDLLGHIAALEADLEAHREANATASCAFCEWRQPLPGSQDARKAALAVHVKECPNHPMRALEASHAALHAQLVKAANGHSTRMFWDDTDALLKRTHPGAALLKEHRKALIRARNEGLEKAAQYMESEGQHGFTRSIRALKESES